ncbi:MAG TPA: penicillin-binding protein 2 [Solirubrobacterales bacterium]|nr:penicillin-binding protein 2 [Solirubrobacterales bacterium]
MSSRLIDRRVGLLFSLFVLLLAVVVARATWVQAVQGGSLSADAESQQVETVLIPGHRGSILDRNGKPLAVSEDAASVFATPYQVEDPAEAARKLGRVLELPSDELLTVLADRKSGFAYLARKVDLEAAEKVRKLDLAGIGLLPDSRRVYPQGRIAGQVIGSVGIDNQGLTGLEAAEDDVLRGEDGEREVVRDALGDELGRTTIEGAELGQELRLTIDASIQGRTDEVLREIGQAYQPDGATAIVVDPRTSDVLAMANWPAVDPDRPDAADPEDLGSMATGFTFEPGSTFKAFTVAGALEDGVVEPGTLFDLAPTITLYDRTIGEAHERGHVSLTVAEILAQSSNVGAVTIGLELGAKRFDHWIRRFGFGEPTGIEFPGEERGIVIPPEEYSGSTMGNLPIGQGLSVTAAQMVAGYAAIANGGILRPPQLILDSQPPPGKRVIKRSTANQVREMLEGVLAPGGTAEEISVPGYTLAGKTGTAQKVVDGEYSESEYVASFVGFAPADDPRLLVSVVVDNPKGDYYGGTVAAPAFGEIAKFALPYLGIPPDGS